MTHVTCRLTAKNRNRHRNPRFGSRVWATFTFTFTIAILTAINSVARTLVTCLSINTQHIVLYTHTHTHTVERPSSGKHPISIHSASCQSVNAVISWHELELARSESDELTWHTCCSWPDTVAAADGDDDDEDDDDGARVNSSAVCRRAAPLCWPAGGARGGRCTRQHAVAVTWHRRRCPHRPGPPPRRHG